MINGNTLKKDKKLDYALLSTFFNNLLGFDKIKKEDAGPLIEIHYLRLVKNSNSEFVKLTRETDTIKKYISNMGLLRNRVVYIPENVLKDLIDKDSRIWKQDKPKSAPFELLRAYMKVHNGSLLPGQFLPLSGHVGEGCEIVNDQEIYFRSNIDNSK